MEERTWTVSEVATGLRDLLGVAFPDEVWVEGEIASLSRRSNGHVYFDLVDVDDGGDDASRRAGGHPSARLPVVLFSRTRGQVNEVLRRSGAVRMTDGVRVRLRARLTMWVPAGRVQLVMSAIDPEYTVGRLAAAREALIATLAAEGILRANAVCDLAVLARTVGLVTSASSAAHADAIAQLSASPVGLRVVAVDCPTQGPASGPSVAAAIDELARRGVDVIAVVRGGGARTDLAAFDTEVVARAIASCDVAVFTGIGHDIDQTVADRVAHSSFPTPTACAAAIVQRAAEASARLERITRALVAAPERSLGREHHRLAHHRQRLARVGDRMLERERDRLDRAQRTLGRRVDGALAHADRRVGVGEARLGAADPARQLARGWSITRTGSGELLRSVADVSSGEVVTTLLADGTVRSVVDGRSDRSRRSAVAVPSASEGRLESEPDEQVEQR